MRISTVGVNKLNKEVGIAKPSDNHSKACRYSSVIAPRRQSARRAACNTNSPASPQPASVICPLPASSIGPIRYTLKATLVRAQSGRYDASITTSRFPPGGGSAAKYRSTGTAISNSRAAASSNTVELSIHPTQPFSWFSAENPSAALSSAKIAMLPSQRLRNSQVCQTSTSVSSVATGNKALLWVYASASKSTLNSALKPCKGLLNSGRSRRAAQIAPRLVASNKGR